MFLFVPPHPSRPKGQSFFLAGFYGTAEAMPLSKHSSLSFIRANVAPPSSTALLELLDGGSRGNLHLELIVGDAGRVLLHVVDSEHQLNSLLRAFDDDL